MRKKNLTTYGLMLALATFVSTAGAANPDKKCVAAIAAQVRKAGLANFKQTIGSAKVAGAPATSGFDLAKISRKCPSLPSTIGYTGCPAIASECADDSDASLAGYAKCVDCLLKNVAGRVSQKTAPAKCGNNTVDQPDENCDSPTACASGQVCVSAGKGSQCHCFTLPCGNGKADDGETCDPNATPSGCDAAQTVCSSACTCLPPVCGDGLIQGPEACDPGAATTGCGANELCSPQCTCIADCQPTGALTKFEFTTLPNHGCSGLCVGGSNIGGTCLSDGACPASTCGGLPDPIYQLGDLRDASNNVIGSTYAGCLYFGGGRNDQTPPAPIPDGAVSILTAVGDPAQQTFTLSGNAGTGIKDCSLGWNTSGQKYCWNGANGPNTDGTCTSDADCELTVGVLAAASCNPPPRCLFGPPLPIKNGPTSTCLLNVLAGDMTGTLDASTGSPNLTIPLASMVVVTGLAWEDPPGSGNQFPCPRCIAGLCNVGPKAGQACVPSSGDGSTSLDCPPILLPPEHGPTTPATFGAPLPVTLSPTGVSAASISAPQGSPGRICTAQGYCDAGSGGGFATLPCSCDNSAENPPNSCESATCGIFGTCTTQANPGASGYDDASVVRSSGTAAGCLRSGLPLDGTIASVFCIPNTGLGSIDQAADLPGPGTIILPIRMQLKP